MPHPLVRSLTPSWRHCISGSGGGSADLLELQTDRMIWVCLFALTYMLHRNRGNSFYEALFLCKEPIYRIPTERKMF